MRKKKPPTERINGTMDIVLFQRMEHMMKADRIFGQKEFLEKLVREEWHRRISSTAPVSPATTATTVAEKAVSDARSFPPDAEPPPPPPPTAVRATKAVRPKGRKGQGTG